MRNKCKILTRVGIVAVIASLPMAVHAQPDNLIYVDDFTTGSNMPTELWRDGQTFITILDDLIVAAESSPTREGGPDGATTGFAPGTNTPPLIVVLGGAAPSSDGFSSPDAAIDVINSMTLEVVEFGHIASLGVVESSEIVPNLSQNLAEPPLLFKLYYSLLEAMGIEKSCSDPTDDRGIECDERIAAR